MTDTYFVTYTIEGDFATDDEIICSAIHHSDPPTEIPTVAKLSDRISYVIARFGRRDDWDGTDLAAVVADVVEIVTLGNVPRNRVAMPSPPHAFCGSNSERQSVGDPGHCERCVEVGHVKAHPSLGCGDVGCDVGHGPEDES
jgi:hypothetical protein